MPVVLERRDNPGVVDKVGTPLSMRTPTLLAIYRFRFLPGQPAETDRIPDTAPVLDDAPTCWVGDDGMLRMLGEDGSTHVAGRARGADAVMPASMGGTVTTGADGRAKLDWSSLKLKTPPSWVDVGVVGKPLVWAFDADWTATGTVVSVLAPKPGTVLTVSVDLAGGQPAVGVRLAWRVWA